MKAQAPMPSLPIERGRPGPGLLAHVLVGKYCDHLPLYRQSGIYAREGVDLDRALLADWVGKAAWLLSPLVEAVGRHVMAAEKLHADDTPVPVLAPGTGQTRTGRLWVYLRDERPHGGAEPPAVLYRYSPDRRGEHPRSHLAGFSGFLQADGYSGFGPLYKAADGRDAVVTEVACWAHARRYFHDIHVASKAPLATDALERIGRLFDVERAIDGLAPAERQRIRQARARPLVDDLAALYSMQVQGSGKARLPDGQIVRLAYAEQNGHPFTPPVQAANRKGGSQPALLTRGIELPVSRTTSGEDATAITNSAPATPALRGG